MKRFRGYIFYICMCIEKCWYPVCRVQTGTWSK